MGARLKRLPQPGHKRQRERNLDEHQRKRNAAQLGNIAQHEARSQQHDAGLQPELVGGHTAAEDFRYAYSIGDQQTEQDGPQHILDVRQHQMVRLTVARDELLDELASQPDHREQRDARQQAQKAGEPGGPSPYIRNHRRHKSVCSRHNQISVCAYQGTVLTIPKRTRRASASESSTAQVSGESRREGAGIKASRNGVGHARITTKSWLASDCDWAKSQGREAFSSNNNNARAWRSTGRIGSRSACLIMLIPQPASPAQPPVQRLEDGAHQNGADTMKSATNPSDARANIDKRIADLNDWRGETLATLRRLIHEADPGIVEEWKWRGVPVWSHAGIVCTGEIYKSVVKLTFAQGAALADPTHLFNSSLEGNVRRAIDVREGEMLDQSAFKALILAAAAVNDAAVARRPQRKKTA